MGHAWGSKEAKRRPRKVPKSLAVACRKKRGEYCKGMHSSVERGKKRGEDSLKKKTGKKRSGACGDKTGLFVRGESTSKTRSGSPNEIGNEYNSRCENTMGGHSNAGRYCPGN